MTGRDGGQRGSEAVADIVYLIDELEQMVGESKRWPMGNRVMVAEDDFLSLVDQLREALPVEIKQAQRVLKERERIVGEAQDTAARIVQDAQQRAQILVSEHTVLAEAKHQGEEVLRKAEEQQQRTRGEMEVFLLQQLRAAENSLVQVMATMEGVVERSMNEINHAKEAIGQD